MTAQVKKDGEAKQVAGSRYPAGDWIGDSEPGGCECRNCGCIFIGAEWRSECKVCAALSRARGEAKEDGDE